MGAKILKIIPKPIEGSRVVLVPTRNVVPVIKGNVPLDKGGTTYQCGNCGLPLISNIREGQVRNIVIKCPLCGEYNEV